MVKTVFKVTKGTPMHALVMTGLLLGLRPGEIRALKWEHVRFEKGFLDVMKWARKGGYGKTKTEDSYRGLPIPKPLLAALEAHKEQWGGHPYVFTREDGTQWDKDGMAWRVRHTFREAGLPPYDPLHHAPHVRLAPGRAGRPAPEDRGRHGPPGPDDLRADLPAQAAARGNLRRGSLGEHLGHPG